MSSIFIGVVGYLFIPIPTYMVSNTGATTNLIDALVSWGLCDFGWDGG
jgi:hypothetical protein